MIETTQYKYVDVVKFIGQVDSKNAPAFKQAFDSLMDSGRYHIVLDMSEITYLPAVGTWVLHVTQRECRKWNRGDLVLACPTDPVREALDLTSVPISFDIYDELIEAVGSV